MDKVVEMRYTAWALRVPDWLTWKKWMAIVFVLGFVHASSYALLVPPWQAPDEPGHFEYGCLLEPLGRPLSRDSLSLALQHEILVSMNRNNFWEFVGEPQPGQSVAGFSAVPFLVKSGRQVGDEPRLYYLIPSVICRANLSIESRLQLTRLYGAALFGLSGVVAAWGLKASRRNRTRGVGGSLIAPIREGEVLTRAAITVSALLVLLPMPSFVAGSVNNDGLAILTGTAVFAIAARICFDGVTKRLVIGLLFLLVLALLSKKTTLFLLAWVAFFALVEISPILRKQLTWRSTQLAVMVKRQRVLVPLIAVVLVTAVGSYPGSPSSKGWYSNAAPFALGVSRIKLFDGGSPNWAYMISDRTATAFVRTFQWLEGPNAQSLAGQALEGTAQVRSPTGDLQLGCLVVRDTIAVSRYQFIARDSWQSVSVSHTVSQGTDRIQLAIAPGSCDQRSDMGTLLVDNAALYDPSGRNLVTNGDFEGATSWLGWLISNLRKEVLIGMVVDKINHSINVVQHDSRFALSVLLLRLHEMKPSISNPQLPEGDRALVFFRSLVLLFPGFWGNFGWLQRPLPIAIYGVPAIFCCVAILGLIRMPQFRQAEYRSITQYWFLGAGLVVTQSIVPMLGHDWQPQGRYLFPALFPIVGLMVVGLNHWVHEPQGSTRVWFGFLCLLMLDGISLHIASQSLM